jgi:hypothetical protein
MSAEWIATFIISGAAIVLGILGGYVLRWWANQ